jgi:hypothetical protein
MKKLTPDKNAKESKIPLLPSDFDIKEIDKSLEEYKKKKNLKNLNLDVQVVKIKMDYNLEVDVKKVAKLKFLKL